MVPIHAERRVHGDLRPRSIIFENLLSVGDKLEDLIRSTTSSNVKVRFLDAEENAPEVFPAGAVTRTGTFRRRYDSPQRLFEKKTPDGPFKARPGSSQWFAPTDIFSLGVILLRLACGDNAHFEPFLEEEVDQQSVKEGSLGPTWSKVQAYHATKNNRQLKAHVLKMLDDAVRKRSNVASQPPEEQRNRKEDVLRMSEVILACMRSHTDASMADLKSVISVIDEFEKPSRASAAKTQTPAIPEITTTAQLFGCLQSLVASRKEVPNLVKSVIYRRAKRLIAPLADLEQENPHWSIRASGRPMIVDTMVSLILELQPQDRCEALVTSNFFKRENMGVMGRVTTALQLAALTGREIEWLILVNINQLNSREVGQILQAQRTSSEYLNQDGCVADYGVRYVLASSADYARVLEDRLTSIRIVRKAQHDRVDDVTRSPKGTLIAPDYHGEDGLISALRIWSSPDEDRWTQLSLAFEDFRNMALNIGKFTR